MKLSFFKIISGCTRAHDASKLYFYQNYDKKKKVGKFNGNAFSRNIDPGLLTNDVIDQENLKKQCHFQAFLYIIVFK